MAHIARKLREELNPKLEEIKDALVDLKFRDIGNISKVKEPIAIKSFGAGELPSTTTYNFVGITNPSTTHIAKVNQNFLITAGKDEGTEFIDAEYTAISVSDDSRVYYSNFVEYRFRFQITESVSDITTLLLVFEGRTGVYGSLYLWNYATDKWQKFEGLPLTEGDTSINISTGEVQNFVENGFIWCKADSWWGGLYCDYIYLNITIFAPTDERVLPVAIESGNITGFATQTTLASILTNFNITLSALRDAIVDGTTPKDLKDLYDELLAIKGFVDGLEGAFTTLNAKDFATQTTLAALNTKIPSDPSKESGKLTDINTKLATMINRATTPAIYNVTMTNADTEYSQALSANTKKFLIRTRDGTSFRFAYVTGKVAAPTAPYLTIPKNVPYWEDFIQPSSLTLYFGCASAGKIAEIVEWY